MGANITKPKSGPYIGVPNQTAYYNSGLHVLIEPLKNNIRNFVIGPYTKVTFDPQLQRNETYFNNTAYPKNYSRSMQNVSELYVESIGQNNMTNWNQNNGNNNVENFYYGQQNIWILIILILLIIFIIWFIFNYKRF